jgi:lipopolysaccharide export system protein LptA
MDGFKNSATKTSLFLALFVITTFFGIPQNPPTDNKPKITKVNVENADSVEFEQNNNPDIYVLRGNVIFRHDSTYMYCDSSYWNTISNSLEAFDNVRIEQGDTLFMYGDYLNYYGNTQLAKMRENVKMENNEVTLFTDSFDYDRKNNLAYYFDGGMLIDSLNELTSIYGQYSPDTKMALFRDQVRLVNPQFVLTTDSLIYNTETKVATIVSPTVIEADSGFVYSSWGWYNTLTDESMLYDRSVVVSKDKTKTITADSLSYKRTEGFIEAFGDMVLNDTVQKTIIMGNYGYYDEKINFAFATDSAQMIEYSQRDSSYLHADTILMHTIDSVREVKAYYGVRFYRIDLQGVCDSLQYNTADSILRLFKNPILWNESYQITGDTIKILFNDSTIERMYVLNYAFAIQEIDSTYFNQLKGRNLTCFFDAGEIYQMIMEGNGEAIYYTIDEKDLAPLQLSKSSAPFITFWINNRKIIRIKWEPENKMDVIPIPDLTPDVKFLQNFVDYNYIRPKNKEDIFVKPEMKAEDIPPPRRTRQRMQQE